MHEPNSYSVYCNFCNSFMLMDELPAKCRVCSNIYKFQYNYNVIRYVTSNYKINEKLYISIFHEYRYVTYTLGDLLPKTLPYGSIEEILDLLLF